MAASTGVSDGFAADVFGAATTRWDGQDNVHTARLACGTLASSRPTSLATWPMEISLAPKNVDHDALPLPLVVCAGSSRVGADALT